MLSVVIPAYNEESRLPWTLERMRSYLDAAGEEYEVLVVDDGSSDSTVAAAQQIASDWSQLRVLRLEPNQGKGAAVRAGMLAARGEVRLFSDADLSTPMDDLPRLRERLGGRCQVAIASRAVSGAQIQTHQPGRRELMGRIYNRLLQALVLPGIHDSQCGFKVFSAEAAVACFTPLRTPRFGFDAEVLLRARRRGWEIAEVPVHWRHVEASRVAPLRDGFQTFVDLLRLRLTRPRD